MVKRYPPDLRAILDRLNAFDKADLPPIVRLQKLVQGFRRPGSALGHIAARGETKDARQGALMLLFLACQAPQVPDSVRRQLTASARPVLLEALRDPSTQDETKYMLGPLYDMCGGKLDGAAYEACFADFAGTAERMAQEHARGLKDSLESIEARLEASGLIRHDAPPAPTPEDFARSLAFGAKVASEGGAAGAGLLATTLAIAIEHGAVGHFQPITEAALELIERPANGRSAWLLQSIGRLPASGAVGQRAGEIAKALETRGIRPEAPRVGPFSHGLASGIDGAGDRNVTLFFRTDAGELDALVLLLNERIGVKDAWAIFGNAADLDDEVRERSGDAVAYAPCTIEFARRLLADAYATHASIGAPVPGRLVLYGAFLGSEPIEARRHMPNLGAYALETYVRGRELVEGSDDLFESAPYRALWFSSDAAYDFVASTSRRKITPATIEKAVDAFLPAIAAAEKDLLASRLAANLEIEALGGRAGDPANRMATRVWLALSEGVVPFHEIPYVRCLGAAALRPIRENLARGYRNQREANKASLETEGSLAAVMEMLEA